MRLITSRYLRLYTFFDIAYSVVLNSLSISVCNTEVNVLSHMAKNCLEKYVYRPVQSRKWNITLIGLLKTIFLEKRKQDYTSFSTFDVSIRLGIYYKIYIKIYYKNNPCHSKTSLNLIMIFYLDFFCQSYACCET